MIYQPHKPGGLLGLVRPRVLTALVSTLWLMTFLAYGVEPEARRNVALDSLGTGWALAASAVVALGLGVFMMALNDALDARHDRAFEPDRPIPSGQVTQRTAFAVAMTGLLAALAAAVAFGSLSIILALVTAGAIIFYNFAGRFVPAVGIVTLGLVVGIAALVPNPRLAFAWPILLLMSHIIAAATLRYWLAGKRPRLSPVNGWGVCVGWVFWSLVVLMLIRIRGDGLTYEELRHAWIGPAVAAAIFGLLTWLMLGPASLAPRARRATAARFAHVASAWLIVFNASWLFAAGLWWQGLILLSLLIVSALPMDPGSAKPIPNASAEPA